MRKRAISKVFALPLLILSAALFSMALHAVVPGGNNNQTFDSRFVLWFGFPMVASAYFLLLFTHCTASLFLIGRHSLATARKTGTALGFSFSLIYLVGMQEIMVEASPFLRWGENFVVYQLLTGIADALPALLLSLVVSSYLKVKITEERRLEAWRPILLFTALLFLERTFFDSFGVIKSDIASYPVQTAAWNLLMGATFGLLYGILGTILRRRALSKILLYLATIGVQGILFNSFIGLIFKDAMGQALLRGSIDVFTMAFASTLTDLWSARNRRPSPPT